MVSRAFKPLKRNWLLILTAALAVFAMGAAVYLRGEDIDAIERSRVELTHEACVDQNRRHDAALAYLFDEFGDMAQDFAVGFMAAILPKRDCDTIVRDRFGYVP